MSLCESDWIQFEYKLMYLTLFIFKSIFPPRCKLFPGILMVTESLEYSRPPDCLSSVEMAACCVSWIAALSFIVRTHRSRHRMLSDMHLRPRIFLNFSGGAVWEGKCRQMCHFPELFPPAPLFQNSQKMFEWTYVRMQLENFQNISSK